ncbi:MAG TPA: hypothetical protein VHX36_05535 [Candidatus Acidoferrales bacterium]|nr:hypothetical protein [Candidatus Acidoferrales bacterium]
MRISRRHVLLALAGVVVILFALNEVVARSARDTFPRQLMARVRETPGVSVLALGNSLVGVGFEASAFDDGMELSPRHGMINLGLGNSTPVEHLMLLRYTLHNGEHPRLLIYGFFDFQLTHPAEFSTSDFIGNRAMLYYLEPEYARQFYHLSLHDRVEFEIMRHFPLFVDRTVTWERVELFRRALGQQGMPPEKTNALGRANDFSLLEYPSTPAFIEECGRASRRDLIPSVHAIIEQGRAAGMKVVFVEMPLPPAHLESFYDTPAWAGYRSHVESMLAADGAQFIDASHMMPEASMFADPLHMTYEASKDFSRRVGQSLKEAVQGD